MNWKWEKKVPLPQKKEDKQNWTEWIVGMVREGRALGYKEVAKAAELMKKHGIRRLQMGDFQIERFPTKRKEGDNGTNSKKQ